MKSQDILLLLKIISMHIEINGKNTDSDIVELSNHDGGWWEAFSEGGSITDVGGVSANNFNDDALVSSISSVEHENWKEKGLRPSYTVENDIQNRFTVRNLELYTGISKSQISLSLNRMYDVGLAKPDRALGIPKVNIKGLLEFIAYGIKYVFPAKEGALSRGITTSIAAPALKGSLMSSGEIPPVWADPRGKTKGVMITPLHPNIFQAIQNDNRLYAMLALVDAIRIGRPREHNLALEKLEIIFQGVK
ncbi:TPA: hypothetical protein ACS7XC_001671 [Providencia alcalifaciens]